MTVLVASGTTVYQYDGASGELAATGWPEGLRPTSLAADPHRHGRAWCGTTTAGVLRSDDRGRSWRPCGPDGAHVTSVAADPSRPDFVWAGTEPSALLGSGDGGERWERATGLLELPSSSEWSFPPKPETHHVRWIACHPRDEGRLWLAVEAGALVRTPDGGRTWTDRVPDGPYDTHELAIHPDRPDTLRVAAGDGYYESENGGETWDRPMVGLDVGYLRSVAVDPGDPETVLVSASSGARTAYVAGHADGRLYRRVGRGPWERVLEGWPETPENIAPLLFPGIRPGEVWAADERGLHRSRDGGASWERAAGYRDGPANLRGLAVLPAG